MKSRLLEIGAGPNSFAEYQIDLVKFPRTTHVLDVAVEDLPFEDDFFDEVHAFQILEHVPTVIYYKENGKFYRTYPRVHVMREIFRVLKPGGIFRASVPTDWPYWAQDPTHADVPVVEAMFEYFCGGYGATDPNDFAHKSYGIDFAFQWVKREKGTGDFFNSYVVLRKPNYVRKSN